MDDFIKALLKPMPVEQRVSGQILRPLHDSGVLDAFCAGKLKIERELQKRSLVVSGWEVWRELRAVQGVELDSSHMLVSAIPRNDPSRPLPKSTRLASVWILMAYLYEQGLVKVPIAATAPFRLCNELYIAYWGVMEGFEAWGSRLYLIREQSKHEAIARTLTDAFLLVSEPVV